MYVMTPHDEAPNMGPSELFYRPSSLDRPIQKGKEMTASRAGSSLRPRARVVRGLVATAAIGLLLASCSDDSESSSETTAAPTTTEAPTTTVADTCADAEALQSSVAALEDIDVVAEGTNGLTAAVDQVKTDLEAFGASASEELQPDVEALQTGVDSLEAAIDGFDTDGAAPVVAAVTTVGESATALIDAVDAGACG